MSPKKRISILLLLVCCLGCALPAQAQMTDDQIVQYIQTGVAAGKTQAQIGRELVARGVTRAQIERLRDRFQSSQNLPGGSTGPLTQQDRMRTRTPLPDRRVDLENPQKAYGPQSQRLPGEQSQTGQTAAPGAPWPQNGVDPAWPYERYPEDSLLRFDPRPLPLPDSLQRFGHNIFADRELTFEPNENLATPENFQLGPGDEVIIDIWGANEDNIRQRISPDGSIWVEQLGPVYLNGLTIREASEKIRRSFAQKYADVMSEEHLSDIRVTLGEIRSISVNIMGEVRTPGTYRLSAFASLFHALYSAGGVTDIGSLRSIRVMRSGSEVATADLYEYLFNGKLSNDVRLREGDVIVVPPYEAQVTVQGRVKRPMYYEVKRGEPLSALIAYAGGFAGDAYAKEVGVTRQTGRERSYYSVDEGRFGTFGLEDGDSVRVGATLNRFANRVEVQGAVFRPGMYELGSGGVTSVRTLIERADGVTEDAFLTRAQLLREKADLTQEMLALDLKGILSGRLADVPLRRNDVLIVPNSRELHELGDFTIHGEVAWPGDYPYAENTTIEDLIIQAGGLLESASTAQVDVMRRVKSPRSKAPSEEVGQVFRFEIKEGFVLDGGKNFTLEPFDIVAVRRSPGYQTQQLVIIDGEVVFDGYYALVRKNERLSDLIARAGGVTPDAYLKGGRLIRRMNEEERAVREAALLAARQQRGEDSIAMERMVVNEYFNVGIELDRALEHPGSDYDVILREGDRVVVPQYVSTVTINGEVMNPNTTTFIADKPLKYYISQAGGYADNAKKSRAYIVYMNGMVAQAKSSTPIEPGCEIIVPSKRKRNPLRLAEILSLTTSATSLAAMITAISKK